MPTFRPTWPPRSGRAFEAIPCRFYGSDLKIPGRGGPRPLSRRHGRLLPRGPDRDGRSRPHRRLRSAESQHGARRQDRQSPRVSGDPIGPAVHHARTGRRQRHAVYARSGKMWTHEILVADSTLALPEIGVDSTLPTLRRDRLRRSKTSPVSHQIQARLTFSSRGSGARIPSCDKPSFRDGLSRRTMPQCQTAEDLLSMAARRRSELSPGGRPAVRLGGGPTAGVQAFGRRWATFKLREPKR